MFIIYFSLLCRKKTLHTAITSYWQLAHLTGWLHHTKARIGFKSEVLGNKSNTLEDCTLKMASNLKHTHKPSPNKTRPY